MSDTYDPNAVAAALNRQQATNTLAQVSTVPSAAAASAIQTEKATGYPARAGMFDPTTAATALKQSQDATALQEPGVSNWVAGAHPAHVAAAQDDLPSLAKVAQSTTDFLSAPWRGLWDQAKAQAGIGPDGKIEGPKSFGEGIQRELGGLLALPGLAQSAASAYVSPVAVATQQAGMDYLSKTIGPDNLKKVTDVLNEALLAIAPETRGGVPALPGAAPEAGLNPAPGEFGSARDAARAAAKTEPPEGMRWEIQRTDTGYKAAPVPFEDPSIGTPPPGVSPQADSVRGAMADLDAGAVAKMEDAVAESPIAKSSPETMQDFLEAQPGVEGKSAYIDSAKLMDLDAAGKVDSDLLAKLIPTDEHFSAWEGAAQSGGEYGLPLSDYLAAVAGHPAADALREITRFSEDGTSQAESKELWNGEAEPTEPEHEFVPPPIEHDPELSGSENAALKVQEPAIQAAAKQAANEIYLKGIFSDAKSLGMNEADLKAWSGKVQSAQAAIYTKLIARAKAKIKAFQTPQWKATYQRHYASVSNDFLARPAIVARNQLTSSASQQADLVKDNGLVKDGKPITFYRTTPYHDTKDGEVPMDLFTNPRPVQSPHPYWRSTIDLSSYKGASFAEDPKFVEGWGSAAKYQPESRNADGSIAYHEKRSVSWVTHIKTQSFGDFRRPEDVKAALDWYAKHNPQEKYESDQDFADRLADRKNQLEYGGWNYGEDPRMMKDLGWDAVRMMEGQSTPRERPNIFVTNPSSIFWKYDLGSVPTKIRLALSERSSLDPELLKQLPRGIWDADGEPIDSYAEQLGFNSGDEMLREMASIEQMRGKTGFADWLERQIKAESAERAKDELGWDLSPTGLLESAKELVDAPEVEDLLVNSLRGIAKAAGLPFDEAALQAHAKDLFEGMSVKDATNVQSFERAIRNNSRKVEQGLLRGNAEKMLEAFKSRQQQLLNYYMLREAHVFKKTFEATMRNWQRIAARGTSPTIDQDFLNQIHVILRNAGFRVNRQPQELADSLGGVTLDAFLGSIRSGLMVEPAQAPMPTKMPVEMKVSDYRDLRDMVNGLKELGRGIRMVYSKNEGARLESIGDAVAENGDAVGRRYPLDKMLKDRDNFFSTMVARAGKVSRVIGAYNIRPETYLFYLDQDKFGPLMKYVVDELAQGRYVEDDLHKSIMKDLEKFYATQPKGWLGSMNASVEVPELQHRGIQWIRNRGRAITAALNLGTVENAGKMARGFGWDLPTIEAALGRVLRPEDWAYVRKIWEIHEQTLWPKIVETYRDKTVSGVPPRKKQTRMVQTPTGPVEGGYFGLHYDSAELERLGLRDPTLQNPSDILGGEYRSAAPSNNYTQSVSGFAAPLDLSFDLIPSRIGQIIHDIAWRKPLIQANKVLNHPKVVAAVQETLGSEFPRLNRQWLEYIAREAVYSGSGGDAIAQAIRAIRSNFMATQILFRVSTMALHVPTAAIHMLGEGGNIGKAALQTIPGTVVKGSIAAAHAVAATLYGRAQADFLRTPGQLTYWLNFIDEKSGEIRNIEYGIDRDVRDAIIRVEKTHGPISHVKAFGFGIFAFSKKIEARITWLARYRQVMDSTNNEAQAVALANKSVRDTQGAGSVMDLPPVLRGGHDMMGELGKTSTTLFMGFRNTFFNREWRIAVGIRRVAEGDGRPDDWNLVKWILTFIILPAAWYKFEQENYAGRATSYVESLLHQTLGSVPLGDLSIDIGKAGLEGKNPVDAERHSPEAEITGAFTDDFMLAMGKPSKQPVRSLVDSIGYLTGFGPDQFGIAAQHAWDVSQGNAPNTPLGYLRGEPSSARRGRGLRRGLR